MDDLFKGLKVSQIKLVRDRETDRPKGYGYVDFADKESYEEALERNGSVVLERPVTISPANPKKPQGYGGNERRHHDRSDRQNYSSSAFQGRSGPVTKNREAQVAHEKKVYQDSDFPTAPPFTAYVGNFDYNVTSEILKEFFNGLAIKEVRIMHDKETGRSKGHGYVEFIKREDLINAMNADGVEWNNRFVRVDIAKEKKQEPVGQRQSGFGGRLTNRHPYNNQQQGNSTQGPRRSAQPEEFKLPTEEEQAIIKNLVSNLKPLAVTSEPSKKSDPFGGARPRDENAYQKRMAEKGAK